MTLARRTFPLTWLPALVLAAGAAIRLATLSYKSLWLDEVATLHIAGGSVGAILASQTDPHPPLYYLLLHAWIGLGHGEALLRLPSALAGILAIPLLYVIVRAWGGRWSALPSAAALALAPLHVWYSQETRMYALACCLGLASTLFYVLALRQGRSLAWIGWVVVTLVGLYTDYTLLFVLAGQLVFYRFCLGERTERAARTPAWSGLLAMSSVLLCFEPQARGFLLPVISGGQESWQFLYYLPARLLSELGLPVSPVALHDLVTGAGIATLALAVLVAVWLLPARPWRRWRLKAYLPAAALAVYTLILLAGAVSRAWGLKRQLLVLLPYVLAGIVGALSSHPQRTRLVLVLGAITLPFTGYALLGQEQEGWRAAAQAVAQAGQPGDVVAFHATYNQIAFDYYYQGDLPRVGVRVQDVPARLAQLVSGRGRVWLALCAEQVSDPQEAVQRWFDQSMALRTERVFGRVRLRLYEPR